MASTKRKEGSGSPGGKEQSKKQKFRKDDEETGTSMLQFSAGKIQGPDDGLIENRFTTLFYSIISFAQDYFKGLPYNSPRKLDHKDFFDRLTGSGHKSYLASKHPGAKERIIQAAIWYKLVRDLLKAPTGAFLPFKETTIKTKTDAPEDFYAWRTLTANFLSNSYKGTTDWGEGGAQRHKFIEETVDLLLQHSSVQRKEDLKRYLEVIANQAFELAKAMACSRAYWVCVMMDPPDSGLHGFKNKKQKMEEVELWNEEGPGSKSVIIDLIVAPMLMKFGTSSGGDYSKCRVVKKAQVVMKAKKGAD